MRKKSLIETNPYLKDPDKYEQALITNVASSTAVELGVLPQTITNALERRVEDLREFIVFEPKESFQESD
jgi:hypothetical protein